MLKLNWCKFVYKNILPVSQCRHSALRGKGWDIKITCPAQILTDKSYVNTRNSSNKNQKGTRPVTDLALGVMLINPRLKKPWVY